MYPSLIRKMGVVWRRMWKLNSQQQSTTNPLELPPNTAWCWPFWKRVWGFPGGSDNKESAVWESWAQSLRREDPLKKGMASHSRILPGEFHGQRSLGGYSPWGPKELDTTGQLILSLSKRKHSKIVAICPETQPSEDWGVFSEKSDLFCPKQKPALLFSLLTLRFKSLHPGPRDSHAEWSKSDREAETAYDTPYMWNLKRNYTKKFVYKTERDSQT